MKIKTKYQAAAGTLLLTVAGYVAVAYYGSDGTSDDDDTIITDDDDLSAFDPAGFCDVWFLGKMAPKIKDAVRLRRLDDGRFLWSGRLRGVKACGEVVNLPGYIGSSDEEVRRHPDLKKLFDDGKLPAKGRVHTWCCDVR